MFVFFSFIYSLLALTLAFKVHDKYDPARYFSMLWGGQIIVIYLLFQDNFSFTGYGLVYISITCLIFSFGTLAGRFLGAYVPAKTHSYTFKNKRALLFLKISFLISLINVLQGIYASGFSIMQILSFNILLDLNNAASTARYTGGNATSIISQITLIFVYITPLFGGYLLPLLSGIKKYWCYLSVLPSLLITLTQAVKLGFITSVILWGIGLTVSSYANNNTFYRIRPAIILKIAIFSVLFIAILFLSMVFRIGKFDMDTIYVIADKFVNYAFGHLPAFDIWFSKEIGDIKPSWGTKTFYGISNFLGIAERRQGVFSELTIYGKNSYSGMGTNVYTMFRFILEDFGFLGSMLVMFLTGSISGYSWLMLKKQNNILFFQTIQIAILFFVLMSFATSVWAYTSYVVIVLFMYLLLVFSFSNTKAKKIQYAGSNN